MAIEVPSGNTTLLKSEVADYLVKPLAQESTFLSAGPQIFDTPNPLRVPRIASGVAAASYAAGELITDGDVSFDEVQLLPSTLKSIKTIVWLSNELIRQSVVPLEATIQTQLVTDVAAKLDSLLWDGTGAADTVKGILRASGIATGVLDLTDPDSLIDALALAQGNKVSPTHWVMTAASFAAIRKVKVGTGDKRYVIDPSTIQNGTAFRLLGLPVIITDNIPAVSTKKRVALVDFGKVAVARDVDADVKILDQTKGDYDSVGVRVVTRYDVALLQPKAVTLLTEA